MPEAAHRPQSLIHEFVDVAPVGLAVQDREGRIVEANQGICRLLDASIDDVVGRRLDDLIPELDEQIRSLLEVVAASGERSHADLALLGEDDSAPTWLSVSVFPLPEHSDHFGLVLRDVTDEQMERAVLVAVRELNESVAAAATLEELERVVARGAMLVLGTIAVHLMTVDPETGEPRFLEKRSGPIVRQKRPPAADQLLEVQERGEWTSWGEEETKTLAWTDSTTRSLLAEPVRGESGTVGVILWELDVAPGDQAAARELTTAMASTAATAFARVARAELDRRLALTYQRTLLPDDLPECDGLELTARYLSAMEPGRSGGDWYDVVQRRDGATVLIAGDAVGHGIAATVDMGHVRNVCRSAALELITPAEILGRVDKHVHELGENTMAAISVVVVAAGEAVFTAAVAAQPPPVLVDDEGRAEVIDIEPGPFVGSGFAGDFNNVECDFQPGAMLVLYTDGLVGGAEAVVDDKLREILGLLSGGVADPGAACDLLLGTLEQDDPTDDVVLLAARRDG